MNYNNNSNNLYTSNYTSPLENISVEDIVKQIGGAQNFDASAYWNANVGSKLDEDIMDVINGIQSTSPTQSQSSTTQPSPQQAPTTDNFAKNYKYKTFYGGTQKAFDAVDMRSMGLKGGIWNGNSVPFISKNNVDSVRYLDDYLSNNGIKFLYTSAMGGQHKSSNSGLGHGDGSKGDLQTQSRVLTPTEYKHLFDMGYFGNGTGAVGYEYGGKTTVTTPEEYNKLYRAGKVTMANGNHYDLSFKMSQPKVASLLKQQRGQNDTVLAFDTPTPSQSSSVPIDSVLKDIDAGKMQAKPSSMNQPSTNLFENFLNDARRIGTGLNYVWANLPDIAQNAPQAIKDYFDSGKTAIDALIDVGNLLLEDYNIDIRKLPERDLVNIMQGIVAGAYSHPLTFLTDFISLGGAGVAKKLINKVPVLSRGIKAGKVEEAIAEQGAKVAEKTVKLEEYVKNADKLAQEGGSTLSELAKAAEEGIDIPKAAKPAFKELRKFSKQYNELEKAYAPQTYKGEEHMSIVQKILRDRQKIDPNITFLQVEREVTPLLDDMVKNGIDAVLEPASRGDRLAAEVYNAKRLFDEGRIFPVTHALAEVDSSANKGLLKAAKATGEFTNAGRFSNRIYGTATYDAIADQLRRPDEFLEGLTKKYLNGQISGAILRGELGGLNDLAQGVTKNIKYVNRELLENGQLQEALSKASKERILADDIAIDADILAPLREQSGSVTGALDGLAQQIYQTAKSNLLAQGTYIGANVITGAANAVMNSGAGLIGDIVSAIKSKGQLAKNLGVYRRKISNAPDNSILKAIHKINRYTGAGQFQEIDRSIQNVLAEVAAHAEMRRAGIPYADRLKAISDADKINIGKTIVDIKRAALINGSKTLLPKSVADVAFMGNPFWRWQDTATQSTYRMLEKHPIMANIALLDIAANIGFDKEMQNRLNLNVDMDKPYVSFKLDPKGQKKTISAEFVPITTTLKFADFKNQSFAPSIPFFTSIYNAMGGLDRYGRPMKRPDQNGVLTQVFGTTRQIYRPETGWMPAGGQADEIINTSIKSLIGAPNLYNRTIAPIFSSIISPTGQYYQPYDMALFGSYDRENLGGNAIKAGAPTKGRTALDVIKALGGIYEQDYKPQYDRPTILQQQKLTRQHFMQNLREAGEGY